MPSASATPAASVSSVVARTGSRARAGVEHDRHIQPCPGGENQVWPRRPRPAVCSSATTTRPSIARLSLRASVARRFSRARRRRRRWSSRWSRRYSTVRGETAQARARALERRGELQAPAAVGAGLPACRGSGGFDFKADVDRRRGMRERADRDEVGAGRGELGNALERDAAGDFDLGAAAARARPPRECRSVVMLSTRMRLGAGRQRLVHLRPASPLRSRPAARADGARAAATAARDAAGQTDVIVLDQDRVEEPDAMVRCAAGAAPRTSRARAASASSCGCRGS